MSSLAKAVLKISQGSGVKGSGIKGLQARFGGGGNGLHVRVGLPDGKTEADGTLLTTIGWAHEFGLPERGIPERSFLRSAVHEQAAKYSGLMAQRLRKVANGNGSIEQALSLIGVVATADIQTKIAKGDFVPLKPQTIKRKGSSKPLIDTGNMRQSVTWSLARD